MPEAQNKMRLFRTVIVFDVVCAAETEEEARKAVRAHIREGYKASEEVATEITHERNIRAAWRDEKPFVGDDVSDADFERVKGKTTIEVFEMLHVRDPKTVTVKK